MNYCDRSKDQKVHEYDMNKAIKIKIKKKNSNKES